jgi:hypothetical protein
VTEGQGVGLDLLKLLGILLAIFGVMSVPVAVGALLEQFCKWRERRRCK